MTKRLRTAKQRGAALGVVMVLLIVLLMAGGMAVWGLRSETTSASTDRLERQLFDCAEAGLAWGKQYWSSTDPNWSTYFKANNICSYLPCWSTSNPQNPFHLPATTATAPTNYPNGAPYTCSKTTCSTTFPQQFTNLQYTVALYDNADETGTQDWGSDNDLQAVVWSRCIDLTSNMSRTVQTIIQYRLPGCNGYNNQNNAQGTGNYNSNCP